MQNVTSDVDFGALSQWPNDPLRTYLNQFKETLTKMLSVNDHTALVVLKCGLSHESRFLEDLTIAPPATVQNKLHECSK